MSESLAQQNPRSPFRRAPSMVRQQSRVGRTGSVSSGAFEQQTDDLIQLARIRRQKERKERERKREGKREEGEKEGKRERKERERRKEKERGRRGRKRKREGKREGEGGRESRIICSIIYQ